MHGMIGRFRLASMGEANIFRCPHGSLSCIILKHLTVQEALNLPHRFDRVRKETPAPKIPSMVYQTLVSPRSDCVWVQRSHLGYIFNRRPQHAFRRLS